MWFITTACVAVAATVTAGQGARSNADTVVVSPVMKTHILQPGVLPPDDVGRRLSALAIDGTATEPGTSLASAGLVINATFDSTITSDPNAAAIETTINNAIAIIQSQLSDPITVNITFKKIPGGLGQSS